MAVLQDSRIRKALLAAGIVGLLQPTPPAQALVDKVPSTELESAESGGQSSCPTTFAIGRHPSTDRENASGDATGIWSAVKGAFFPSFGQSTLLLYIQAARKAHDTDEMERLEIKLRRSKSDWDFLKTIVSEGWGGLRFYDASDVFRALALKAAKVCIPYIDGLPIIEVSQESPLAKMGFFDPLEVDGLAGAIKDVDRAQPVVFINKSMPEHKKVKVIAHEGIHHGDDKKILLPRIYREGVTEYRTMEALGHMLNNNDALLSAYVDAEGIVAQSREEAIRRAAEKAHGNGHYENYMQIMDAYAKSGFASGVTALTQGNPSILAAQLGDERSRALDTLLDLHEKMRIRQSFEPFARYAYLKHMTSFVEKELIALPNDPQYKESRAKRLAAFFDNLDQTIFQRSAALKNDFPHVPWSGISIPVNILKAWEDGNNPLAGWVSSVLESDQGLAASTESMQNYVLGFETNARRWLSQAVSGPDGGSGGAGSGHRAGARAL